jgi:hypothetical protein
MKSSKTFLGSILTTIERMQSLGVENSSEFPRLALKIWAHCAMWTKSGLDFRPGLHSGHLQCQIQIGKGGLSTVCVENSLVRSDQGTDRRA